MTDYEHGNKKEEADIMTVAAKILKDDLSFANEMREYVAEIRRLQEVSPSQSQKDAKAALKRTGVLTSKGAAKKKIVSWE